MELITWFSSFVALSYNQPKFCPNASWNPNATTFADINTVGVNPHDIFVNTNNTIYVANQANGGIVVWSGGNVLPTKNISTNLTNPYSLFVTTAGEIYVAGDNPVGRIDKGTLNSTIDIPTMYTCNKCYDVFVDINNNLYCSMNQLNQVVTKSLNSLSNALTIVAGTGIAGYTSNMLNFPSGIYVDINLDLYVADKGNDRVQLFRSGQLNGITVAGNGSANITITLNHPTGIVLDADNYLFIVDNWNYRIVGSGPNGFRCVAGCSSSSGSASNQLYCPEALSFDSYGNMFVTDPCSNRVQKFDLSINSCGKCDKLKLF